MFGCGVKALVVGLEGVLDVDLVGWLVGWIRRRWMWTCLFGWMWTCLLGWMWTCLLAWLDWWKSLDLLGWLEVGCGVACLVGLEDVGCGQWTCSVGLQVKGVGGNDCLEKKSLDKG